MRPGQTAEIRKRVIETRWKAHTTTEQFGDQEMFMNGTGILSVVYTEEYYVMESI